MFFNNINNLKIFLISFLSIILVYVIHTYFFHLDLLEATRGFSVLEWIVKARYQENFLLDYSGGSTGTASNIIYHIITYVSVHTNLEGILIQYILIFFEISVFFFGVFGCTKAINKLLNFKFSFLEKLTHSVFFFLILSASNILNANVFNFFLPYFHGPAYGFSLGLSLLSIGYFFEKKIILSHFFLILNFSIHPIFTIVTLIFIYLIIFFDFFILKNSKFDHRIFICASVTILFILLIKKNFFHIENDQIGKISDKDYIEQVRLYSIHMFNFDLEPWIKKILYYPFLSLYLIFILSTECIKNTIIKKKIIFSTTIIFFLSLLGAALSKYSNNPFIIKLNLQRAGIIINLLFPFFISYSILYFFKKREYFISANLISFLIISFFSKVLMIVQIPLMILFYFLNNKISKFRQLYFYIFIISFLIIFFFQKINFEIKYFFIYIVLFLIVYFFLKFRLIQYFFFKKNIFNCIYFLLIFLCFFWGLKFKSFSLNNKIYAKDYKEIQVWSRINTSKISLFMVDPRLSYGWREFSERSSIGTPTEWFHSSFFYNSNFRNFIDGRVRGLDLGINIEEFYNDKRFSGQRRKKDIDNLAVINFYNENLIYIKKFYKKYNVDYFVFIKKDLPAKLKILKPEFENNNFIIYSSRVIFN